MNKIDLLKFRIDSLKNKPISEQLLIKIYKNIHALEKKLDELKEIAESEYKGGLSIADNNGGELAIIETGKLSIKE